MTHQSAIRLDLDIIGYIEICTYVLKPYEEVVLRNSCDISGFETEQILWTHHRKEYKIVVTKYHKSVD